ncbi:MAG: hypothetical protein ABH840_04625 [Nanoarchaeota archaeon]
MIDYHMIDGVGKTPVAADRDVRKKSTGLTDKLKGADVSTDLSVVKTVYIGEYFAKNDKTNPYEFKIRLESPNEWEDIRTAAKIKVNLSDYDSRFRIEKYLDLTNEQKTALKGTRGGPGAALDYGVGSSADVARRLM